MIEVSGETESDVIGKGTDLGEMAETGRSSISNRDGHRLIVFVEKSG